MSTEDKMTMGQPERQREEFSRNSIADGAHGTHAKVGSNSGEISQGPPGQWSHGPLPSNVLVGSGTVIQGELSFKRFRARTNPALVIGSHCTMDGVHFAIEAAGRVAIGDHCYFTNALLLCELELRIGSYVMIGWNASVSDSDFHPIGPAERIADAVACSPLSRGRPRPEIVKRPVIIEDGVWIGPSVTILKGVTIGSGAFIEPGALVTRDIPPRARVMGNPAQIIGEVS
jgi:acetyltransferase-like isoleucine patch superfamily enzyme